VRFPAFLRTRRSLLAEIEALTVANRKLTEERDTAVLVSWVRRNPSPEALVLPDQKPASKRTDPHVVQVGRHARAEPVTEFYPRVRRTP
jgi:hypothetical protein